MLLLGLIESAFWWRHYISQPYGKNKKSTMGLSAIDFLVALSIMVA